MDCFTSWSIGVFSVIFHWFFLLNIPEGRVLLQQTSTLSPFIGTGSSREYSSALALLGPCALVLFVMCALVLFDRGAYGSACHKYIVHWVSLSYLHWFSLSYVHWFSLSYVHWFFIDTCALVYIDACSLVLL